MKETVLGKSGCAFSLRGAIGSFKYHGTMSLTSAVSVLAMVMTLVSASAHAGGINKCVDSEGKVTFTDTPCARDKQSGGVQLKSDGRAATVDSTGKSVQGGDGLANSEPVFDTSSEASTIASRDRVYAALSPEKRDDLKASIMALLIVEMALRPDATKEDAVSAMNKKLNGKTAREIFTMAAAIKTDPAIQKALRNAR